MLLLLYFGSFVTFFSLLSNSGFTDRLRVPAAERCRRQPKRREREGPPASRHVSGTHGVSREARSGCFLQDAPVALKYDDNKLKYIYIFTLFLVL